MKNEVVCGKLVRLSDQGNARRSKQEVYEKKTLKSFCTNATLHFSRTERLLPGQTCMCRGVACGDGWCDLIDLLCSMIQFGAALIRRPCASRRSGRNLACCAFTFAALMRGYGA